MHTLHPPCFVLLTALSPTTTPPSPPSVAGTLCITINSGKVKEADSSFHLSKASDPYVEVRFAGYLCRTHVADGDNTPTWNFDCGCAPNIGEQVGGAQKGPQWKSKAATHAVSVSALTDFFSFFHLFFFCRWRSTYAYTTEMVVLPVVTTMYVTFRDLC